MTKVRHVPHLKALDREWNPFPQFSTQTIHKWGRQAKEKRPKSCQQLGKIIDFHHSLRDTMSCDLGVSRGVSGMGYACGWGVWSRDCWGMPSMPAVGTVHLWDSKINNGEQSLLTSAHMEGTRDLQCPHCAWGKAEVMASLCALSDFNRSGTWQGSRFCVADTHSCVLFPEFLFQVSSLLAPQQMDSSNCSSLQIFLPSKMNTICFKISTRSWENKSSQRISWCYGCTFSQTQGETICAFLAITWPINFSIDFPV